MKKVEAELVKLTTREARETEIFLKNQDRWRGLETVDRRRAGTCQIRLLKLGKYQAPEISPRGREKEAVIASWAKDAFHQRVDELIRKALNSLKGPIDHLPVNDVYPEFPEDVSTHQGPFLAVDLLAEDSQALLSCLEALSHAAEEREVLGAEDRGPMLCISLQIQGPLGSAVADIRLGLQGNAPFVTLHRDCEDVSLASTLSQAVWPRDFQKEPKQHLSDLMLLLHVEECRNQALVVVQDLLIGNVANTAVKEQTERQGKLGGLLVELETVLQSSTMQAACSGVKQVQANRMLRGFKMVDGFTGGLRTRSLENLTQILLDVADGGHGGDGVAMINHQLINRAENWVLKTARSWVLRAKNSIASKKKDGAQEHEERYMELKGKLDQLSRLGDSSGLHEMNGSENPDLKSRVRLVQLMMKQQENIVQAVQQEVPDGPIEDKSNKKSFSFTSLKAVKMLTKIATQNKRASSGEIADEGGKAKSRWSAIIGGVKMANKMGMAIKEKAERENILQEATGGLAHLMAMGDVDALQEALEEIKAMDLRFIPEKDANLIKDAQKRLKHLELLINQLDAATRSHPSTVEEKFQDLLVQLDRTKTEVHAGETGLAAIKKGEALAKHLITVLDLQDSIKVLEASIWEDDTNIQEFAEALLMTEQNFHRCQERAVTVDDDMYAAMLEPRFQRMKALHVMRTAVEAGDYEALRLAQHDAQEAGVSTDTLEASTVTRKLLVWSAYKDPPKSVKDVETLRKLVFEAEEADVVQLCWGGKVFKAAQARLAELQFVEDAVSSALAAVPDWLTDITQDLATLDALQEALRLAATSNLEHHVSVLTRMIVVFKWVREMKQACDSEIKDVQRIQAAVSEATALYGKKGQVPLYDEEFHSCINSAETAAVNEMLLQVDDAIDLPEVGKLIIFFNLKKVLKDSKRKCLKPNKALYERGLDAIDRWDQAVLQGTEDCNQGILYCCGGDVEALEELVVRAKRLFLSDEIIQGLEDRKALVAETKVVLETLSKDLRTGEDLDKLNWAISEADKLRIHAKQVQKAKKKIAKQLLMAKQ